MIPFEFPFLIPFIRISSLSEAMAKPNEASPLISLRRATGNMTLYFLVPTFPISNLRLI